MASNSSDSQPEFRILLDQGFPKPSGFVIAALDQSVDVVHFSDFAPDLAAVSTPDWFLYKGMDDPVREWGQLLAYLPDVKQRCLEGGGRAILLPSPSLSRESFHHPKETLAGEARIRKVSVKETRSAARAEIVDWLTMSDQPPDRFDRLLGH